MSLAAVQIATSEFLAIQQHMASHPRGHRNMHVRRSHQQNNKRVLLYLHALHTPTANDIEGVISGPGTFWHYQIKLVHGQPQIRVLTQKCTPLESKDLERRFLVEILKRVAEEKKGNTFAPRYSPGQFYLKRRSPGMSAAHPNCQQAIAAAQLHVDFVAKLQGWNLMLLHP